MPPIAVQCWCKKDGGDRDREHERQEMRGAEHSDDRIDGGRRATFGVEQPR
jgi:hypothetical protein